MTLHPEIEPPCVLKNESNESYHSRREFISASRLKTMSQTPLHFKEYFNAPEKKTSSLNLGSLVHTLLFEPSKFEVEYYLLKEPVDKRTSAGKVRWAAIEIESGSKQIVSVDEKAEADAMVRSALNLDAVIKLLSEGEPEESIYWKDEETGLLLKTRPDFQRKNNCVIDGKTCKDASPDGFARAINEYRYLLQAAMQVDGIQIVKGNEITHYYYICIENSFPYAAAVYRLGSEYIYSGQREYKNYLKQVKECEETGVWGGYETLPIANKNGVIDVVLPNWSKIF